MRPTRFTTGASVVATVSLPLAGVSPLVYGATGVALVAAVQSFGMLAAAFAGYTAVEALELVARGQPLADDG